MINPKTVKAFGLAVPRWTNAKQKLATRMNKSGNPVSDRINENNKRE